MDEGAIELLFDIDAEKLRESVEVRKGSVLDGSAVAEGVEGQVEEAVGRLGEIDVVPKLAFVRVGDHSASEIYVRQKIKSCERLGIESEHVHLSGGVSPEDLSERIATLTRDDEINGILVQLPLPDHLNPHRVIDEIVPIKDVDGFHPYNLGGLMAGMSQLEPCTPRGIMTLLRAAGVDPAGEEAVVIGRSRVVGRPMAQMLLRGNATVTVCHRHTEDLAEQVGRANILVVATGVPELVDGDWIREGATVIDVGISREEEGGLVGDVEFDRARQRAGLITPVPGGVGPMTVATLMQNTVAATCWQHRVRLVGGRIEELGPTDVPAPTEH